MPKSYVPLLRELSRKLKHHPGVVHYPNESGPTTGFSLKNTGHVAVMDANVPAATEFPDHRHDSAEVMVVYRGEIRIKVSDTWHTLRVGDHISIPAGVKHRAVAVDDTWLIAITIPADEGYADE